MTKRKSFTSGDIVLVPFPFSDLSKNKVRPAVVLACDKEDYTLIFVTTVIQKGALSVEIVPSKSNNLKMKSYVRYTKFASLDRSIILGKIGTLSPHDCESIKKHIKNYLAL